MTDRQGLQALISCYRDGDAAGADRRLRELVSAPEVEVTELLVDLAACLLNLKLRPEFEHIIAHVPPSAGRPDVELRFCEMLVVAGEFPLAVQRLRALVVAQPHNCQVQSLLGYALLAVGARNLALTHASCAVQLSPADPVARRNLGLALFENLRVDEAIVELRSAHALAPSDEKTASNLLYMLSMGRNGGNREVIEEHRQVATATWLASDPGKSPAPRRTKRPIRIGYVSADLRDHPVAHFLAPVLAGHDRRRWEPYVYDSTLSRDASSARLQSFVENWRNVAELTDRELAELIRRDGVDVLVDLSGHTTGTRLGAFAGRAAPTQLTWLGYPNTTGLPAIDYRVVDPVTAPVDEPFPGVESPLRLQGIFACFSDQGLHAVDTHAFAGPPVFGCLHRLQKLNADILDLWARILDAVPDACILVARDQLDPILRLTLTRQAASVGADPRRIRFADVAGTRESMSSCFAKIDFLLDVQPWSGHTIGCLALSAGVPVLTQYGASHAGRMMASVLHHADLHAWTAESRDALVQLAVRCSNDVSRLRCGRNDLRHRFLQSRACDEAAFVRDFETAIEQVAS